MWVVGQFALIGSVAVGWLLPPRWPAALARPLTVAGTTVAAAGCVLAGSGYRALGRSFTMLPEPRPEGQLVERGAYRLVRHPMYGGGLLLLAGASLARGPAGLLPTAALAALWSRKAAREERALERTFGGYAGYRSRVRRRFLPGIL